MLIEGDPRYRPVAGRAQALKHLASYNGISEIGWIWRPGCLSTVMSNLAAVKLVRWTIPSGIALP